MGARETVGAAMAEERGHLLSCATEGFDLAEVVFPLVDKQGCVTVKTNFYSVPVRAGTRVEARVHPLHVEIWHAGRLIARHERCHSRRQHVLDLEHYLDVLSHKPGAFAGSKPLAQWREAGRWPACYDELWDRLRARHGKQNGTRAMVAVLALGREFGHDRAARGGRRHGVARRLRRGGGALPADRGGAAQSPARCRSMSARWPATTGRCQISPITTRCSLGALRGDRMMSELQDQAIRQHCKALRMPTIGSQFARLAEAATREGQSHVGYLEALLAAEMEERESRAITRLLHEARLPRMKTLEAFEFDRSGVSAAQLRTLAEGDYVTKAEPVLLVGEAGTGKTHLATGLCVAACRQRRRVRFTTATALINELAEAAHANQLSRALGRWERLDLICIDELGYVPLAETACELMFQVIADRAEKAAVIVTTNLPFSEWSQVIPNPRLCKALIDRLTDQAHIITTGTDSYRFRRHHGAAQGRQIMTGRTEKRR